MKYRTFEDLSADIRCLKLTPKQERMLLNILPTLEIMAVQMCASAIDIALAAGIRNEQERQKKNRRGGDDETKAARIEYLKAVVDSLRSRLEMHGEKFVFPMIDEEEIAVTAARPGNVVFNAEGGFRE